MGLIFVGIDVIDGNLTEINVTSPTGLRAIKRLGGPDLAAAIWDTRGTGGGGQLEALGQLQELVEASPSSASVSISKVRRIARKPTGADSVPHPGCRGNRDPPRRARRADRSSI